jgi:hypothetical protein
MLLSKLSSDVSHITENLNTLHKKPSTVEELQDLIDFEASKNGILCGSIGNARAILVNDKPMMDVSGTKCVIQFATPGKLPFKMYLNSDHLELTFYENTKITSFKDTFFQQKILKSFSYRPTTEKPCKLRTLEGTPDAHLMIFQNIPEIKSLIGLSPHCKRLSLINSSITVIGDMCKATNIKLNQVLPSFSLREIPNTVDELELDDTCINQYAPYLAVIPSHIKITMTYRDNANKELFDRLMEIRMSNQSYDDKLFDSLAICNEYGDYEIV